jgi:hypothetical protein
MFISYIDISINNIYTRDVILISYAGHIDKRRPVLYSFLNLSVVDRVILDMIA